MYDWSIWTLRIKVIAEKRKQDKELLIELERNSMALLVNVNRAKNSPTFTGKDFYKLSYDEITETVQVTGEVMMKALEERFKDKPIKKRGR